MHIPNVEIVTVVPRHYLTWEETASSWVLEPRFPIDSPEQTPHALSENAPISFSFAAPRGKMSAVFIMTATFGRVNTAWIHLELIDGSGRVLCASHLSPAEIHDNLFIKAINLSDTTLTIGAVYTVRVSSPMARENDCFAIWSVPSAAGRYEHHQRLVELADTRVFLRSYRRNTASDERTAGPSYTVAVLPGFLESPSHGRLVRDGLATCFPNVRFNIVELDQVTRYWAALAESEVVVFVDVFVRLVENNVHFDDLCFSLHKLGVVTVFYDLGAQLDPSIQFSGRSELVARDRLVQGRICHFTLIDRPLPQLTSNFSDAKSHVSGGGTNACTFKDIMRLALSDRKPHVVIVTVLYKKASVVDDFLDHVMRQSYDGNITVVLVNDCSPDNDVVRAQAYAAAMPYRNQHLQSHGRRDIEIIENERNLGNCHSRLAGLSAVRGDIYVVIDCDCLINRDFVGAHVFEHWDLNVDVVIGPLNIESGQREPKRVVEELEEHPDRIPIESELQDPVQTNGFVNCITRNFSVKARLCFDEPLFDVDFSYSASSDSGFGWEDVEMGYRLYKRRAFVQYTSLAFSVHCSHQSSMPENAKIIGSMRNFLRLFKKHPEMLSAARRWAVETYTRISEWAAGTGVDGGALKLELDTLFASEARRQAPLSIAYRNKQRRLRVLTYRWHVPHQYELYKLPCDFTLVTDLGNPMVDRWSYDQRPLRSNVRFAASATIDTRDFDVAILHFDENVLCSDLSNGTLPAVWGDPFRRFLALSDLPKVAICHGTVPFEGQYGLDFGQKKQFVVHAHARDTLVKHLSDAGVSVVCNSLQAMEEWGFPNCQVIWHGFDPQEFPVGTYQRDILCLQMDLYRPHYRGAWEHGIVSRRVPQDITLETASHRGASLEKRGTNNYAVKNFRSYIDRISQFTVYLNTTLRSPMPRSRGEAMMTGVIPVSLRNHDVDHFIRPGVNGFYSDDPAELADYATFLCRNKFEAIRVGSEARRTAMDVFNHDRYLTKWARLLAEVTT